MEALVLKVFWTSICFAISITLIGHLLDIKPHMYRTTWYSLFLSIIIASISGFSYIWL